MFECLFAQPPGSLVVIEACANAGWVRDLALGLGHAVKVSNTVAAELLQRNRTALHPAERVR